jgi:predicted DNA-binding protein
MRMSVLDRRVQILLDAERYEHLEREASSRGQSVAAIIREAIDSRLATHDAPRQAAADYLLASADTSGAREDDWADVKAAMETDLAAKLL